MLTGLELMFMGLTRSNCDLFSSPCFFVSPVGKRVRRKEKKGEGKEGKGNRKGMEGRKEEKKEEGIKKIRGNIRRNFNKN